MLGVLRTESSFRQTTGRGFVGMGVLRTESSFRPTTGRGICIKLPILIRR